MLRNTAKHCYVFCILWMLIVTLPALAQGGTDDDVLIDKAYINNVTINDDLTIDVEGELGDSCTDLGDIEQTVEGRTITVNIMTRRPADLMCAAQLQVFETTITLDVSELPSGENTLIINGTEYNITIPETAAESASPTCDDLNAAEDQSKFENDQFCFLYPDSYSVESNDTLTLLTSRERISGKRITLLIEVLEVDDTVTSLDELEIIVADTYPDDEIKFEQVELGKLDALLTDSITMRSGASRHLYVLWDEKNLVILELQPLTDDNADAVDELWTVITETWAFVDDN